MPLKQYTDLYRSAFADIDAHSAMPLNALRPAALSALDRATLPRQGADNYENCDLAAMLAPDYGINIADLPLEMTPGSPFSCDVPVAAAKPVLNVNDHIVMPEGMPPLPKGVLFGSLRTIAREHPELVARYYGTLADMQNPVVALDSLLVRDGLMLYVPDGVRLEQPLQMVSLLDAVAPIMAVRRILVIIGKDARAQLLVCDHTRNENVNLLSLQTVEIFVGDNAGFDLYDLEESSELTRRISSLYACQGAGSRLVIDGMTLFNGVTRNEYHCRFDGEHAELRLYGMAIEDRQRSISTYSRIEHRVPRCHSDELFRMSADQESRGAFTGRIVVSPGAVGTEAYQACRNLQNGDRARIEARPELEIYNDDVKCSHGCAIGQLDPTQMFYMQTRGIPEATARLLLRQAFMADVIDAVGIPSLRDRLRMLVEKRFAGALSACAACR